MRLVPEIPVVIAACVFLLAAFGFAAPLAASPSPGLTDSVPIPAKASFSVYKPHMALKYILPWLSEDDAGSKYGLIMNIADRLEKQSVAAQAMYSPGGRKMDYLLRYESRHLKPTFSLDVYDQIRTSFFKGTIFGSRLRGVKGTIHFPLSRVHYIETGIMSQDVMARGLAPGILDEGEETALSLAVGYNRRREAAEWLPLNIGTFAEIFHRRSGSFGGNGINLAETSFKGHHYFKSGPDRYAGARFLGGAIESGGVLYPSFYWLGGYDTLRGFDRDELYGNRMAYLAMEYIVNLIRDQAIVTASVYIDSVSVVLFGDFGDAWLEGERSMKIMSDAGIELRAMAHLMRQIPVVFNMGVAQPAGSDRGMKVFFKTRGLF